MYVARKSWVWSLGFLLSRVFPEVRELKALYWPVIPFEKVLEAIGSMFGIVGAAWLALRLPGYTFAYIPFLLSSLSFTYYFYKKGMGWVMLQQVVFSAINLAGIYCWILK
ncbi:hypothetical protein ACFQAT_28130 [Undibacterium arcticum]|uniref:DoxX family protein n=1 Tax=Undibacterium arcticum TaxID=1762892 RepID=A0ABV7F361_9BURK